MKDEKSNPITYWGGLADEAFKKENEIQLCKQSILDYNRLMKYIYVAIHAQHLIPITAADKLEDILLRADDYMGATEEYKFSTTRLKWTPNDSDYPDDYVGTLFYLEHDEIIQIRIYEIEYIINNK